MPRYAGMGTFKYGYGVGVWLPRGILGFGIGAKVYFPLPLLLDKFLLVMADGGFGYSSL